MACRNTETAQIAKEFIVKETQNESVFVARLDLGSLDSIRNFSEEIKKSEEKIDFLINNAGVMAVPRSLTIDGFEQHFGINHLGHFLLTNLLLDRLKSAESARIVTLSSRMASNGSIDFSDLNYEKRSYGPYMAYSQSKLANVLFTSELARRLEGSNVTAYSVHPGVVSTELYRNQRKITKFFMWPVHKLFMKTPEQGTQTTLYCALEKGIEKHSGKYFADSKLGTLPSKCFDGDTAAKLWGVSEKMVGLSDSDVE